jgi:hypothetical protein
MHNLHDDSSASQAPPPETRWVDLLYQAALLRNTWQPVNIADLPALGAMHSWGLIEFLHVPESRSWFVDDGADPYAEPPNATIHPGGRHWRMAAKGEAWLREVLRRREQLGLDQAADRVATPTAVQPAEPATTPKRRRVSKAEAEVLVRDWLAEHAKGAPDAVTRDAVAAGTGVSAGLVSRTAAWRAFAAERRRRRGKEVALTDKMLAIVPAKARTPEQEAELAELVRQQQAEEVEQIVRHSRRHGRRHASS